ARKAAADRARKRAEQARKANVVARGANRALAAIESSLHIAQQRRDEREAARAEREKAIAAARTELDALGKEIAELTDVVHKDEVARAAQTAKIEQLQQKSVDELGLDPEVLVDEYGPHLMVLIDEGEETTHVPFVRAEQEKRLKKAERARSEEHTSELQS